MSYQIPPEILTLFAELDGASTSAINRCDLDKFRELNHQMEALAMGQMFKAMDYNYEQEQRDTARTLGEGE